MTEKSEDEVIRDSRLPDLGKLPEVRIIAHAPIFYAWPIWVTGMIMATLTLLIGTNIPLADTGREIRVLTSPVFGVIYVMVVIFVLFVTNVTLRGAFSIIAVLSIALLIILLAWAGVLDNLARYLPTIAVHPNFAFYALSSSLLFLIWAANFFIFDRFKTYLVRPGQMIEQKVIGSGERSFDTRGLLFEQRSEDVFRHYLLGFGSGDLYLLTSGGRKEEIKISNVLRVEAKVNAIQKLVNVQPDDILKTGG